MSQYKERLNPEIDYSPDKGCAYALRCRVCPFPTCWRELRYKERQLFKIAAQDSLIACAYWRGTPRRELQKKYDISRSTFWRLIKRMKQLHNETGKGWKIEG